MTKHHLPKALTTSADGRSFPSDCSGPVFLFILSFAVPLFFSVFFYHNSSPAALPVTPSAESQWLCIQKYCFILLGSPGLPFIL